MFRYLAIFQSQFLELFLDHQVIASFRLIVFIITLISFSIDYEYGGGLIYKLLAEESDSLKNEVKDVGPSLGAATIVTLLLVCALGELNLFILAVLTSIFLFSNFSQSS